MADDHRQRASGRGTAGHQDSKEIKWLGTPRRTVPRTRIPAKSKRRSGSISAATAEDRLTPSEHITAEENYQGNKTGYSNAETDPTTVQDTSVKTQTSRTDTQKRNTGTTQITRSLASSTHRPSGQEHAYPSERRSRIKPRELRTCNAWQATELCK